ncbi:MAG TPA: tRNA pseudouridine(55) synthase TruB [candidate division Zixibacteria bacterium]|nr:tRNA pseudouridine(55) synthase TruB [candidate division Zixibacteria bacterium]
MVRKTNDKYHGVLLYHKPLGITSHDAVQEVRRMIAQRSVGHTGTLDPQAEGLLLMCLGSATKISRFLTNHDKVYEAEITLGRRSSTYDREGVDFMLPANEIPELDRFAMNEIMDGFRGEINQTVPAFSAVHVEGERLYKQARAGKEVDVPTRRITIKELQLIDWTEPLLTITVTCSAGTYIRSLAHDIGETIGCGAFLSRLRRTRVGRFDLDRALSRDSLATTLAHGQLSQKLLSPRDALDFPAITVTPEFARFITTGRDLTVADIISCERPLAPGDVALLVGANSQALAVVKIQQSFCQDSPRFEPNGKLVSYVRVLN